MYRIGKTFRFSAGHKLNLKYNSPCNNYHGHNYRVEVIITGEKNVDTNMITDFSRLKEIVEEYVLSKLDHKDLNKVKGLKQPTAENIAKWIYDELENDYTTYPFISLKIKVWETDDSWAEYTHNHDYEWSPESDLWHCKECGSIVKEGDKHSKNIDRK